MGSSSVDGAGEMCLEAGGGRAGRRGGKKAAEMKAAKQPQRGLGVAQLEKIDLCTNTSKVLIRVDVSTKSSVKFVQFMSM